MGRREADPDRVPRPRRRASPARSTSGSPAPDYKRHKDQHVVRAARGGPAARVRRADPRQAPGRGLVGGVVEQPRLGARAGCCSTATTRATSRTPAGGRRPTRPRSPASASSPSAAPNCVSVERTGASHAADRLLRTAHGARALDGGDVRRARWTAAGGGPRTATSPPTSHEARVASEPEERVVDDEPARAAPASSSRTRPRALPLGSAIPGGVQFGTFVHAVLEATDFAAADLDAELTKQVAAELARRPVDGRDRATGRRRAAGGARDAARPARRRLRLRDVARARPARRARLRAAAGRRRRSASAGSRRARSAPSCASISRPAIRWRRTPIGSRIPSCASSVRGYLTGSIDLVAARRRAVRGRRLQDELARRAGRGAARRRTTARPRSPPRWSARTTTCRRCSTPPRCTATCAGGCRATTPTATWPACSTCSCAA